MTTRTLRLIALVPFHFLIRLTPVVLSHITTDAIAQPRPDQALMSEVVPAAPDIIKRRLKITLRDGEKVTVTQVAEEMLKLLVDDLKIMALNRVDPMSIRAIVVRPPLASSLSTWAEFKLASLLHQQSSITLQECFSCKRRQLSIDDQSLILSQGDRFKTKLRPKNAYSKVQSFLEMSFTWSPEQNTLLTHVQLRDNIDQLIWSEVYRSGDEGILAKRGAGDIEDETSLQTYSALISPASDKVLALSEVFLGYGIREGQTLGTPSLYRLGYGYGVFFGRAQQFSLFLNGVLSLSAKQFFFDVITDFRYRLSPLSIDSKTGLDIKERSHKASRGFWVKGQFGVPYSNLISGMLVGAGLHFTSPYRFGMSLNGNYSFNFDQPESEPPLGGLGVDLNLLYHF